MTPATAPSFYRFTLAPASVVRNALEYTDRAVTVSAIALFLGFFLFRAKGGQFGAWRTPRCPLRCDMARRRVWHHSVSARSDSSLYTSCPLDRRMSRAAATVLNALWRSADMPHRARALIAGIVLPVSLIPVYRHERRSP